MGTQLQALPPPLLHPPVEFSFFFYKKLQTLHLPHNMPGVQDIASFLYCERDSHVSTLGGVKMHARCVVELGRLGVGRFQVCSRES